MPAPATVNGNPFTAPVSFGITKPDWALNPIAATTLDTVTNGKLVQVRANATAVLADASDGTVANAAVAQVMSGNDFYYSTDLSMWLTVSGASATDYQPLYLGEAGALSVTQSTVTPQEVGFTSRYRASDSKHFCVLRIRPSIPLPLAGYYFTNSTGAEVSRGFIYGQNSGGSIAKAISGASSIRPYWLVLADTANGAVAPAGLHGRYKVKVQTDKTYTVGSFAWLSGSTAGTVTDTRPAAKYFQIGTFAETTPDADDMILVDILINHVGGA